jgi:predicted nucleic acid-binding protein
MYLLDTNIWLERLLQQARSADVKQLLDGVESFDTDFDSTDLPRQTPAQVLAGLPAPPPVAQA